MNLVKILPKSQRATNRVHEHGEVMQFIRRDTIDGHKAILVKSLDKTWTLKPGIKEVWGGWFKDTEADFECLV